MDDGGRVAVTGFVLQVLHTVLDALSKETWGSMTIEPGDATSGYDKVDVRWVRLNGERVHVQVKHSKNSFSKAQVEEWATGLVSGHPAEVYVLVLLGRGSTTVDDARCPPRLSLRFDTADLETMQDGVAQRIATQMQERGLVVGAAEARSAVPLLCGALLLDATSGREWTPPELFALVERASNARPAPMNGPMFTAQTRAVVRASWLRRLSAAARARPCLGPLKLPVHLNVAVEDVWIDPDLRLEPVVGGEVIERVSLRHLDWFARAESARLIVVRGEMGAGKTSLLWHMIVERATEAQASPQAPLPVFIDANALANEGSHAVKAALSSTTPGHLWGDPETAWIVFVDGLDEVAGRLFQRCRQEIMELCELPTVRGVVVACRDSHLDPRAFGHAPILRVSRWQRARIAAFRALWILVHPPLSGSTMGDSPAHALEVVLAAAHDVAVGHSGARWHARDRHLHAVLEEWSLGRVGMGVPSMRRVLEVLAWEALRRGDRVVSREIRIELGLSREESWLQTEAARLGIYKIDEAGALIFTHRMSTETLAASELSRHPAKEIAAAAELAATVALAELAVLSQTLHTPEAVGTLVEAFLAPTASSSEGSLRRLGALVRVVDELGHHAGKQVGQVAERLVPAATNERSRWIRGMASGWLAEVAERRGPLWDAAWCLIEPLLNASGTRAGCLRAWAIGPSFRPRGSDTILFWAKFLSEEDAAVRAFAVERIALEPDGTDRTECLLLALHDHEYSGLSPLPAVLAGQGLRGTTGARTDLVGRLVNALTSRRQMPAAGAAVALRPDEAPVEDLLDALRSGWGASQHPAIFAALTEMRAASGAVEWLNEHWRDAPTKAPSTFEVPSQNFDGQLPPSAAVRERLLAVIAPAFASSSRWHDAPLYVRQNPAFLGSICRAGLGDPTTIGPVLESAIRGIIASGGAAFLPPDDQSALGAAAERHSGLLVALIEWWDRKNIGLSSSFPGVALEGAAIRGDKAAIRVYAEWLPHSPFMQWLGGYWWPPSADALDIPLVRAAARELALSIWLRATVGKVSTNGGTEFLAPGTLGHALRGLWPGWEGTEIAGDLIRRAQGSEGWFRCTVEAFMPTVFPEAMVRAVLARIADWRNQLHFDIEALVWAVIETRLVSDASTPLWEILEAGHPAGWVAAFALATCGSTEDRVHVATCVLAMFPEHFHLARLRPADVRVLVELSPEAWLVAAENTVHENGFWCGAEVLAIVEHLPALLDRQNHDRLAMLLREMQREPQPWVPNRGFGVLRLADEAAEILHGLGLEDGRLWEDGARVEVGT